MAPLEQAGQINAPKAAGDILRTSNILTAEQPAPTEPARLASDFTSAINLVGTANEKMVDWEYQGPDKDAARKTEPVDLVRQDGKLKDLPIDHPDVIAESARRKSLISTFDTIHTVVTCKQAVADEIAKTKEAERQKLVEAAKQTALTALQAKDTSIQALPTDQVTNIEKETLLPENASGQIESTISAKYFDEEKGVYKKFQKVKKDVNGKEEEVWEPVMENGKQVEVDISDTYKPLTEELERISKLTTDGTENGPPTQQALETQQLMINFKLHPQNEKKLLMYTAGQIETKNATEREQLEIEVAERVLLTLVGPDIGDLEKAKSHANPRIARIAQLIYYSKRDGANDIQRKSAYMALHYELKSFRINTFTPETQELAQFDGVYSQEMSQFQGTIRNILQALGYQEPELLQFDTIPDEQLIGHLSLASACEGKLPSDKNGQPQLPPDAQNDLDALVRTGQLNALAPKFILALARTNQASGILQDRFGISAKDMKHPETVFRSIANFVVTDMEANPRIQNIITQMKADGKILAEATTQDIENALYTHANESFENFKKVFKIPTWMLIIAGLGAMFAQPIGELMKTGEPEPEQRR